MENEALFRVRKARAGLVLDQPFFGVLALRLRLAVDDSAPTAWVDGESLGFNPAYIGRLSDDEVKAVVCHEVLHCVLNHHTRRGTRDGARWNKAVDYCVNEIVKRDTHYKLPAAALFNPSYSGMAAESVYNLLPPDPPQGGKGKGRGSDPGGCGEVRDLPGHDGAPASPADNQASEGSWKVATAQAAQAAKRCGKLPAGLARMVDEIVSPRLPWRDLLKRFVDHSRKSAYSWVPPNRRHVWRGAYIPSVSSDELLPVLVGVDCSGSMSADQLRDCGGELASIVSEARAPAVALYFDTEINEIERFEPGGPPFELKLKGGGGTDFRPVFDWLRESGESFACVIIFTDLCGPFPADPPDIPVLWVHSGGGDETAPFGEVIELD